MPSKPPNDGGPASPTTADQYNDGFGGKTLRDYYRAHVPPVPSQVMDAFIANTILTEDLPLWNEWCLNRFAIQECRWRDAYADAMLAEREKGTEHE